ncbi:MAG: DUF1573 domain-containing protein [Dehalococcoidales bacterium]|nr:DUF1573 domain-containing protein [Dehalococcoidales bacterium]
MKKCIPFLIMLLLSAILSAVPVMEFTETVHDFGMIREEKGPVEYSFGFENTGDAPLQITSVRAS